jgi:glucuronate isomerase
MTPFPTPAFLLTTPTARTLYEEYARDQPIIDYHCHLPVAQIAEDTVFENLTQIWLAGDHYKWRAMRANGVDERYCTGDASDWEKFTAWAETVPHTLGNPLYHWTHLELQRPFGIGDLLLSGTTARTVWDRCNALLATPAFSARGILRQMNVRVVCTTDDPTDSLEHHRSIAADAGFPIRVLPAFRPDRALAVDTPDAFRAWVAKLEGATDSTIASYADLVEALRARHDDFHDHGCRLSDHGLDTAYADDFTAAEANSTLQKALGGKIPTPDEVRRFRSALLVELGVMDANKGWVQQFHFGALRSTNTRMLRSAGPDTGFDSIGDLEIARPLARFLDRLDVQGRLAKTILYNLNPADNEVMATMIGNFQDGSVPGKIQYGSAWWFLDQKSGIERHLDVLANMGLLGHFVGMLTDSRSFLSYSRHDYFRRILCNRLGTEIEQGLLPDDRTLVGGMIANICYGNARRYFAFETD